MKKIYFIFIILNCILSLYSAERYRCNTQNLLTNTEKSQLKKNVKNAITDLKNNLNITIKKLKNKSEQLGIDSDYVFILEILNDNKIKVLVDAYSPIVNMIFSTPDEAYEKFKFDIGKIIHFTNTHKHGGFLNYKTPPEGLFVCKESFVQRVKIKNRVFIVGSGKSEPISEVAS
jgi:hypothetical protein